jgi:hypothetical protein
MVVPQKAANFAKGVAGDVLAEAIGNQSKGIPVTPAGLKAKIQESATQRARQEIPNLEPLMTNIKTRIDGKNTTQTINPPKGRTWTNTKSGRGKGKGNGGRRGNSSGGLQQAPEPQTNTSAYGNITTGSLYTIDSVIDTSYWSDILQDQDIGLKDNASRTALYTVSTEHTDVLRPGSSGKLQTAYSSIYMQKLSEAIGTTGGNASVKNSFTEINFWRHQQYAYSACLKLAEVYTLRAWNPPYEETNTVIRQMKNSLCSNVELMDATNRLEEAVAMYSLPPKTIEIAISHFQTYKKSPVSGGVHTRFISTQMLNDMLVDDGYPATVASFNALSTLMTDTNWTQNNGTINSLLLNKCSGFVSCRTPKVGAPYPTYQMTFNAIFDNLKYSWSNNSTTYVSDEPSTTASLLVAFPFDVDSVPKHVSSSLLARYELFGSVQTGYPWITLYAELSGSRFIGVNDTSKNININFLPIDTEFRDVTDANFSINSTNDMAYFKPIGLNTQLFQPTYPVVVNATRDVIYDVFSMPSMS